MQPKQRSSIVSYTDSIATGHGVNGMSNQAQEEGIVEDARSERVSQRTESFRPQQRPQSGFHDREESIRSERFSMKTESFVSEGYSSQLQTRQNEFRTGEDSQLKQNILIEESSEIESCSQEGGTKLNKESDSIQNHDQLVDYIDRRYYEGHEIVYKAQEARRE